MPQDFSKQLKGLPRTKLEAIRQDAREQFDLIENIPKRLNPKVYSTVEQIPFVGQAASKGIKSVENAIVKPLDDQQEVLRKKYAQARTEIISQKRQAKKKMNDYGKTALGNPNISYPSQGKISHLMGVKVEKFKK